MWRFPTRIWKISCSAREDSTLASRTSICVRKNHVVGEHLACVSSSRIYQHHSSKSIGCLKFETCNSHSPHHPSKGSQIKETTLWAKRGDHGKNSMKKIQKLPTKLTINDMYRLKRMYSISPYVCLVLVPQHLF